MTENTTASGAADRVNAYLDRRATMRSIDPEVVHGIDGPDFELTVSDLRALAASAPVAPTPPDWRELCRRLYVELFHCDKQMTCSLNEDGKPIWRTGTEVRDVLSDAKAALEANPVAPQAVPVAPAPQPAPMPYPTDAQIDAVYEQTMGQHLRSQDTPAVRRFGRAMFLYAWNAAAPKAAPAINKVSTIIDAYGMTPGQPERVADIPGLAEALEAAFADGSAQVTWAAQAAPDVVEELIRERDHRDEIIDALCDAVLEDRPEWSSSYYFEDAVVAVQERIAELEARNECRDLNAQAAPAPVAQYICPVRTVADLVNNLMLMDQTLPIYGAQYIEHQGKRRAIAVDPTVSRERVKDGRWIGDGDTLNAAIIWTRAEQPAPVAEDADPLQGAANWLVTSHTVTSATTLGGRLCIGYNRAERLFSTARAKAAQPEGCA